MLNHDDNKTHKNNDTPLVSITLSTYNDEVFLSKSLDCLTNQTLKEIEIICVNDGSTDSTLKILKEYADKDSRIIIINKEKNKGLAAARNDCLIAARGEYILFLDADDLFDLSLCEKAYNLAKKENSDCVIWDHVVFEKEDELSNISRSNYQTINPKDVSRLLTIPAFTWIKLFKSQALRDLKIKFSLGLTYQDVPVHWQLMTQLRNISILPEKLSFYRQQPNATTHKKGWSRADYFLVMDLVEEYLHEYDLYDEHLDIFLQRRLESMAGVYDVLLGSLKPKALIEIQRRLGENEYSYLKANKPLRWQAKAFYKYIDGNILYGLALHLRIYLRTIYRKVN
jgi:glycosyltransferase involved in cell wall biosynthesis